MEFSGLILSKEKWFELVVVFEFAAEFEYGDKQVADELGSNRELCSGFVG